ncbi:metallophosphoesterase family protein [Thermogemmatispora sp.]|uniref:metallophosphoesterase family protein n=1 Tax=Thermogemmatispora sp. TaxID=1968838 RepID=UPI001E11D551|nr:DNA repair exonuclease [Thermogemmatispora sp.]MBX5449218.1 DNA repair exonuclease [Thermogemmatispora sp.]
MRASFIHVADIHLGYEQYGVSERFNDFARAFWEIMDEAVRRQVDFVVIAGDLFNKRSIDARTLLQAIEGLRRLRERNIPVIAVEGNHDRSYYREGISWLQFLCHQGYLTLLAPQMRGGTPVIAPWDRRTMLGSHVDLLGGRLRVYGLPWQGSATLRCLEGLAEALAAEHARPESADLEYRLLVMHTGIEGVVPRLQGLPSLSHFQPLRPYIDYVALGHIHKPYEFDGWIYNPGSPETWSAEEAQWHERGYYFVEIDTTQARPSGKLACSSYHRATHLINSRRPFVRHELRVDGLETPEAIYARLAEFCQREGPRYIGVEERRRPVVQVQLVGALGFDADALDLQRMEELLRSAFQPLHARVENNTSDRDYLLDSEGLDGRDRSAWHELERRIFAELLGRDSRYLPAKEAWGLVLAELKERALQKEDPAVLAQYLREKRAELLNGGETAAAAH